MRRSAMSRVHWGAAAGRRRREPLAGTRPGPWLAWIRRWLRCSCCPLSLVDRGALVLGHGFLDRVAGERQEDLVQGRLTEREVRDGDARTGQRAECARNSLGIGDPNGERRRIGVEVYRRTEHRGKQLLGLVPA